MLELPHRGTTTEVIGEVNPILASGALLQEQERVDAVPVPTDIAKKIVDMIQYTPHRLRGRDRRELTRGRPPLRRREVAGVPLRHLAVTEEDVRAVAPLVLPHRMWAEDPVALALDALRFAFGPLQRGSSVGNAAQHDDLRDPAVTGRQLPARSSVARNSVSLGRSTTTSERTQDPLGVVAPDRDRRRICETAVGQHLEARVVRHPAAQRRRHE